MLAILDSPLGGIFYSLVALLLVSAASVWLYSRAGRAGLLRQVIWGLGLLMGLRLLQLAVYILAWANNPAAQAAAPALERGVLLFSLAIVAGLWAQRPAPVGRRQTLLALELAGILLLSAVMLMYWLGVPAGSTFNYTDMDYIWSGCAALLALLGLWQIATPPDARRPLGLLHVGLLFLGQVLHSLLAEPFGNLPLLAQAAALLGLPLLFALPVQPEAASPEPAEAQEEAESTPEPDWLFATDEELEAEDDLAEAAELEEDLPGYFQLGPELPSLEQMEQAEAQDSYAADAYAQDAYAQDAYAENALAEDGSPSSTPAFLVEPEEDEFAQHLAELSPPEELTRQLAQELGADVCVLATYNDAQLQLEFQYGYNLLRNAAIEPARLSLRQVPRLASALQRGRGLRLQSQDATDELGALSQALRLSFPAHLIMTPFAYPQDLRRWALLALHIETPWEMSEEVVLEQHAEGLGEQLAEMLGVSGRATAATELVAPVAHQLEQTRAELESLQAENARYRADVDRLLAHIDSLQSQPAGGAAAFAGVASDGQQLMSALQQENLRLKRSLADLQAAPAGVGAPSINTEQAKEELRLALEEVAALHAKLEAAQQAITETTQQQPGAQIPAEQVELVTSIAQELRQPLSSVMGYTDLLLGESVGLLGALQRKFLERVRSSTERMNTLIDNLIRIAELDPQGQTVQRSLVDLGSVIDDALALLREALQEKRIALRVSLPRQLPALNTDRDALQQILYHLLQNADAATPTGGAIALRAVVEEQAGLGEFVLIQVSDSGGGIPDDALPRVFSRVYRAQNPVIPGVGDSGVGLTIAETLTKALGGRIWVESQTGSGATFSVLLPLAPPA